MHLLAVAALAVVALLAYRAGRAQQQYAQARSDYAGERVKVRVARRAHWEQALTAVGGWALLILAIGLAAVAVGYAAT